MRLFNELKESYQNDKPSYNLTVEIVRLVGEELKNPRFAGYKVSIKNNMTHYAVLFIREHLMIRAGDFRNNQQIINYCKQLCNISFVETLDKLKKGQRNNEYKTGYNLEKRPQDEKREDGRPRSTRFHEGNFGRWDIR